MKPEKDWERHKVVNMASITFRALQSRRFHSFKSIVTRVHRCPFCFGNRNDDGQTHMNGQEIPESVLPQGKKLDLVVSCLRVDRVVASGLGMGRRFVFIDVI